MSDAPKKPWAYVSGIVEAFPDKDTGVRTAVKAGDANGTTVYNLTIKTTNQNLVDIALWAEFAHVAGAIGEGFILHVEGPVSQREYNGKTYTKVDAKRLTVIPCVVAQEREVVNAVAATSPAASDGAPAGNPFAL